MTQRKREDMFSLKKTHLFASNLHYVIVEYSLSLFVYELDRSLSRANMTTMDVLFNESDGPDLNGSRGVNAPRA